MNTLQIILALIGEAPAVVSLVKDILSFIKSNGGAPELGQALADLSKIYAGTNTAILNLIHPGSVPKS